jgi:hypothetical protein
MDDKTAKAILAELKGLRADIRSLLEGQSAELREATQEPNISKNVVGLDARAFQSNLVQTQNPRTGGYAVINRDEGRIIEHGEPYRPFDGIAVVGPQRAVSDFPHDPRATGDHEPEGV